MVFLVKFLPLALVIFMVALAPTFALVTIILCGTLPGVIITLLDGLALVVEMDAFQVPLTLTLAKNDSATLVVLLILLVPLEQVLKAWICRTQCGSQLRCYCTTHLDLSHKEQS